MLITRRSALGLLAALLPSARSAAREVTQACPKSDKAALQPSARDYDFLLTYLLPGKEKTHISGLHPHFAAILAHAVRRMETGHPETKDQLRIFSGHRPVEHQTVLFLTNLVRKKNVHKVRKTLAVPGCSEHQYGLAIDLRWDPKRPLFDRHPPGKLHAYLHKHATELGLHFFLGFEPWHIEPLGSLAIRNRLKKEKAFSRNAAAFYTALKKTGIVDKKSRLIKKHPAKGTPHPLRLAFEKAYLTKGGTLLQKQEFAKSLLGVIRKTVPGYPLFPDADFVTRSLVEASGFCPDKPEKRAALSRRALLLG